MVIQHVMQAGEQVIADYKQSLSICNAREDANSGNPLGAWWTGEPHVRIRPGLLGKALRDFVSCQGPFPAYWI